jgi:RNA polymerase sigma factor (sigma-70 family)
MRRYELKRELAEELSLAVVEALEEQQLEDKTGQSGEICPFVVNIVEIEYDKLQTAMSKNFGLTENAFQEMTDALQYGDRTIYEQTFLAHFGDCMQYLKSTYRASHEDAYDATMDAMLEFCKRLEAGKVSFGNLRFLFTRMAGQIYFRQQKKNWPSDELHPDIPIPEEEPYSEEELKILEKVVEELCTDCKHIIKAFYYQDISLKELAERFQKSSAALRKQKQRCMEKLRNLFKKHSQ